ncbi:protein kinase domain-containing protein [Streptomyces xanthophaeus]|uniref:protein kinase domain-containing protein n=1 Tax=Streptomyces xanthophaeus TaxID=67385 RepID=UPI0037136840
MGEVFAGRYELIDPIGRGGAGAVWRAWDHRRRRYVAAKVLLQSDAHTLLRFVREQALRIDHPHVLAPASWAADDDKVLFTMDLVGGGSLAHVIGDYGPLPPRFVCALLDQLLSGLAAVHAEGVVHRDIKPANILMEATGTGRPHLRLSDFGISMRKGEPRLTETNYVVGTPGYFAPEQLMGAEPDFPADLFAVGLVALYLLQGRKPDSQALVEHFLAHGTPGAPEGVPAPLWDVLAGLLQPDPQSRFRTATGARKALAEAVELLPPAAPDEDPVEVFDQLGPLPAGFGPQGPQSTAAVTPEAPTAAAPVPGAPTAASGLSGTPGATAEASRTDPRGTVPMPFPGPATPAATAPVGAPAPVSSYGSSAYGPSGYGPSETGSFHLPPPVPPGPLPEPVTAAHPAARTGSIAPPPAMVTAGILALALLCFAVGTWALTQL